MSALTFDPWPARSLRLRGHPPAIPAIPAVPELAQPARIAELAEIAGGRPPSLESEPPSISPLLGERGHARLAAIFAAWPDATINPVPVPWAPPPPARGRRPPSWARQE